MTTTDAIIYLISCSLNCISPDIRLLHTIEYEELYRLSCFNSVSAMVGFALFPFANKQLENKQDETISLLKGTDNKWQTACLSSVSRCVQYDKERESLYQFFESQRIRYVSLKGIILNTLYPKYGMREYSDNDILFEKAYANDVKKWFESKGYIAKQFDVYHHDSYMKPPFFNFEMHKDLISENEESRFTEYYADPFHWKSNNDFPQEHRLLQANGKEFEYIFSDEDCYIFNLVHAYIHYSHNGTGLRILADTYVYNKTHPQMNRNYLANELKKLGIMEFEMKVRELSEHLLSVPTEHIVLKKEEQRLFTDFITAGTYGNELHPIERWFRNEYGEQEKKAYMKHKYILQRLFPDRTWMRRISPRYGKYWFNLPWLYLYRIGRLVFTSEGRKRGRHEKRSLDKVYKKDK